MAVDGLPHLLAQVSAQALPFKSPQSARPKIAPQRPRKKHGKKLLAQIREVQNALPALVAERVERGVPRHSNVTLAIEVRPPGTLDFTKLEWKRDGVELLAVNRRGDHDIAVISVPQGGFAALEKRVRQFMHEESLRGKPKNAALVNAIENIRRAVFDELWTDDNPPPPTPGPAWFQIWLRHGGGTSTQTRQRFATHAEALGIALEPGHVSFPGRVVVAVYAEQAQLSGAIELLDLIAEIRNAETTAEFFTADLTPREQGEWLNDLLRRTTIQRDSPPYLTLLDTGVARGHPLLAPLLAAADMHAHDPAWGSADHHGHGTEMAGVCGYGDLTQPLSSANPVEVQHRLESVKILPPTGQTPPHLWGHVTHQAAARVEVTDAQRRRIFAMMTTADAETTGAPSEWSATIDALCFGQISEDGPTPQLEQQRLFVVAAGNVKSNEWKDYPSVNLLRSVQSPGQAWNAMTVGACTHLTTLDSKKHKKLTLIAQSGHLAPASTTTTTTWDSHWPYKPDVLAEGGNGTFLTGVPASGPDCLRVLTCNADFTATPFTDTGDTSAATAEVARLCAELVATYPTYWPESIRALVVNGARHTPAMLSTLAQPSQRRKQAFLRTYGFGKVEYNLSRGSASNRATIVMQETIAPIRANGSAARLGDMNFHRLPWPTTVLNAQGDVTVLLRLTLSYFVEPNPSRRGWQSQYRYPSHGLRFAVQGATESEAEFLNRINALRREPEKDEEFHDPDLTGWSYGPQLRIRGSLHSDVWEGSAAQLAAKKGIAVFPVGGWWKDWKEARRVDVTVRYALVATLEIQGDIDVYTPIKVVIASPVVVPVSS